MFYETALQMHLPCKPSNNNGKLLMRITTLTILSILISLKSFGQDSLWQKKVINEILTLNLPANSKNENSSFIRAFGGEINSNFYGFQYYDTIFQSVENEHQFQISLTGFLSGRTSDPTLKRFSVVIVDTSIGGTKGLMAKYTSNDTLEAYKRIYYYVTLANNLYYWFYTYSPFSKTSDDGINYFFKSIEFDSQNLKEKSFKLTPVHLEKNAD